MMLRSEKHDHSKHSRIHSDHERFMIYELNTSMKKVEEDNFENFKKMAKNVCYNLEEEDCSEYMSSGDDDLSHENENIVSHYNRNPSKKHFTYRFRADSKASKINRESILSIGRDGTEKLLMCKVKQTSPQLRPLKVDKTQKKIDSQICSNYNDVNSIQNEVPSSFGGV